MPMHRDTSGVLKQTQKSPTSTALLVIEPDWQFAGPEGENECNSESQAKGQRSEIRDQRSVMDGQSTSGSKSQRAAAGATARPQPRAGAWGTARSQARGRARVQGPELEGKGATPRCGAQECKSQSKSARP